MILCFGETRRASARPRRASIAGFGNTGPLSSTEQKEKDCHDQDKLGPISEPSLRATSAVPDSKKKAMTKTSRYKGPVLGSFLVPEIDMIFGDGVGASLVFPSLVTGHGCRNRVLLRDFS